MEVQHIFIIGSKGIPARYGGFETFVDKLTYYHRDVSDIQYHVACKTDEKAKENFFHNNARCFYVSVPQIGAAQAVYYDLAALKQTCAYIKKHQIHKPIIYILACRIGPFMGYYKRKIQKMGGLLYINPDGHEWKRAKWNGLIRRYWKISEGLMVKHADLLICDSQNIEKYIQADYAKYRPKTTYIAYGADKVSGISKDSDKSLLILYNENMLSVNNYYLVVGRLVPENNYETMIRQFMKSSTQKDLVLITDQNEKFLEELKEKTHYNKDKRIKFIGSVYDQAVLGGMRANAYGYLHGHEVGGTNPSLLEALATTKINLLLDVGFNYEVAKESALYWQKEGDSLADLIDKADGLEEAVLAYYDQASSQRIALAYSWQFIADEYKELFEPHEHVRGSDLRQRIAKESEHRSVYENLDGEQVFLY